MSAGGSWLLLDELWTAGEPRFLAELWTLSTGHDKRLVKLGQRWLEDPRPFARTALLAYIDDGCDRPYLRALTKTLFKGAEARGDDEVMARFMVAFDRLTPRVLEPTSRWDWVTRSTVTGQALTRAPGVPKYDYESKQSGRFSWRTRLYVQRRVLRYFRRLGAKDPARYTKAVYGALRRYPDEQLSTVPQLLGAWSLIHLLYWGSPELRRTSNGVQVRGSLAALAPAPLHPEVWKTAFVPLLELVQHAQARTVRLFAKSQLEQHHADALTALPVQAVLPLLKSPHDEAQALGVGMLEQASGLETLSLDVWLSLLSVPSLELLPRLVALVKKYVAPSRLDLAQAVRLAMLPAAPVAELGLAWAKQQPIAGLAPLMALANAPAPSVRAEAAVWLTELVRTRADATPEDLRDLLDARHADVRAPALRVLDEVEKYSQSLPLWSALTESPHGEVREHFLRGLSARAEALPSESVERVWATTLLSINRGSRAKPRALAQLAERCVSHPDDAAGLLPLLRVALRSVRAPERRAAIAVLTRAVLARPELRALVQRELPELVLGAEEQLCR